jgi:hypothetical protein
LNSYPLNIDGILDDGWGAKYPVKGIELDATILFADITSFSLRTIDLSPIETLIYVNNFMTWMSAEALINSNGIIDKYIGDEIMVVFSNAFGSTNHFVEALQSARRMIERDALDFHPHIGIASGNIVIGYTGTPLKYNCSVFGLPVALAARCASIKSNSINSIVFPASNWKDKYKLDEIFPPREWIDPDGKTIRKDDQHWKLGIPRKEKLKNMPETEILELMTNLTHLPNFSPIERIKEAFLALKMNGFYKKIHPENYYQ